MDVGWIRRGWTGSAKLRRIGGAGSTILLLSSPPSRLLGEMPSLLKKVFGVKHSNPAKARATRKSAPECVVVVLPTPLASLGSFGGPRFRDHLAPADPSSLPSFRPTVASPSSVKRWTSRNKNGTSCSLPAELVLRILHLAWSDAPPAVAARLSLLCKSVLERTRRYLYTCPTLSSATQINLFIKALRRNPALAARVQAMVLDGGSAGATGDGVGRMRGAVTTRLPHLFELCHGLCDLTLRNAIVFSLTDFAKADALVHLTLDGCLLSDRTTTQRYHPFFTTLENVESITLRDASFDISTADHFLCRRTLPRVVALELEGCRLVDDPANLNDLGMYEPRRLAPTLEVLILRESPNAKVSRRDEASFPSDIIERCSTLRSLQVDVASLTPHVLEHLPLTLTHLELVAPRKPLPDVVEPHVQAAQALSTSFLSLAALSTSSTSTPFGTFGSASRSPLSASLSALSTPAVLTPFGSPGPSPLSDSAPLSELVSLVLPSTWNLDDVEAWKSGDFRWAVGRITRESLKRLVEVEYRERDSGRTIRGRQIAEDVRRVRRAIDPSERGERGAW
ncbi:hypothetical protein JCM10212_001902 [Sporobolomyces blumeae]